jgi:hypothetical protein
MGRLRTMNSVRSLSCMYKPGDEVVVAPFALSLAMDSPTAVWCIESVEPYSAMTPGPNRYRICWCTSAAAREYGMMGFFFDELCPVIRIHV